MFFSKFITTALMLLLPGSGFISLCPGDDGEHSSLHFITAHCATHECERSAQPDPERTPDHHGAHDRCDDRAAVSEFLISDNETIQSVCDYIPAPIHIFFNASPLLCENFTVKPVTCIPPLIIKTTVLTL